MSRFDTGTKAKVHIGVPTHDGRIVNEIVNAVLGAGESSKSVQIEGGSALTFNFNNCYTTALNNRRNGVTHFCMVHSDIAILGANWLDRMVAIMERERCDVLSVAMRLKSEDGRTSTAIEEKDENNPRNPLGFKHRKLTVQEIAQRGATWSDPMLLVNTGLMLVDIRKPWATQVWFEFRDTIASVLEGGREVFFPVSLAEDYGFSRMVRAKGGKLCVTTEIEASHIGGGRWSNKPKLETIPPLRDPLHVA